MKKYYISAKDGQSGISRYARDFYRLVLKERGYEFIDSNDKISNILSLISSRDYVHIELGIFQKKEIELLFTMLRANYKHVVVTLHDAPLIKYPFYEFKNPVLNALSKLSEVYANSFGAAQRYVKKIKAIYVLSKKGMEAVKLKYKVNNVFYLPHVVDPEPPAIETGNNNFIYFGFIGKNKGIEYALQLHQQVLSKYPDINFYVVGKPLGKQKKFYEVLQEKYSHNVHYLGYVPEEKLQDTFDRANFALLFFKKYRFFWPASGSILYSLKKGKVLFTNPVNTVQEIVENGKNGFYISGGLKEDADRLAQLIGDKPALQAVKVQAYNYLLENHSAEAVKKQLND
jgi:glycosyltransferase involved in cell wall biosynthesis